MIKLNGHVVKPTIFPDGTSQVWKQPLDEGNAGVVEWEFENEAEVFHVLQACHLARKYFGHVRLVVNYLPYGRQDKSVDNEKTFALRTLGLSLAAVGVSEIVTVDAHSQLLAEPGMKLKLTSIFPGERIVDVIAECGANMACYPDKGAFQRYSSIDMKSIVLEKARDQTTGVITGMDVVDGDVAEDDVVLIVDDICDGGASFIAAAKELKELADVTVHLYVSHGIFSKGLDVLREAGIERIFTYEKELAL